MASPRVHDTEVLILGSKQILKQIQFQESITNIFSNNMHVHKVELASIIDNSFDQSCVSHINQFLAPRPQDQPLIVMVMLDYDLIKGRSNDPFPIIHTYVNTVSLLDTHERAQIVFCNPIPRPQTYGWTKNPSQIIDKVLKEIALACPNKIKFFDIAQTFTDDNEVKLKFYRDGIHLNPQGISVLADRLMHFLNYCVVPPVPLHGPPPPNRTHTCAHCPPLLFTTVEPLEPPPARFTAIFSDFLE